MCIKSAPKNGTDGALEAGYKKPLALDEVHVRRINSKDADISLWKGLAWFNFQV